VIGELQHLPETGEAVETLGWRFEVVDIDGRRIDKVLARRIGDEANQIPEAVSIH
jgi:putative hemolysin